MRFLKFLFLFFLLSCSDSSFVAISPTSVTPEVFEIKGADLSFLPEVRRSNITFTNAENQTEDMLTTLKKSGVNTVRLRLWKNPSTPNSNFETVKSISREIRNKGMKVMLTVHYSDSWADPSKQEKPSTWKNLNINQLQDSVFVYTKKIISEINPDYIQIGNEINNGFLFPEGSFTNLSQMKMLLKKGISAVRQTNPSTKIILQFAGHQYADSFFSNFKDLDYDIIGISYYPKWHGKNLNELQTNLITTSNVNNKPIFIAETSYPFTFDWNDWTNNEIGDNSQILPEFPASEIGQKNYLIKIRTLMKSVPLGIGFCYWGGEWVSYKGDKATDGSNWENQAFWDFKNKALPIIEAYKN